jgi:hypothetical protein
MAVGDAAVAAGYTLVPDSGEDGRVRWGAREINRTRDLVAALKNLIPSGKADARTKAGLSSGVGAPPATGGTDGDVYFMIIS